MGENNITLSIDKFNELLKELDDKNCFKKLFKEIEEKIKRNFNYSFPLELRIDIEKNKNNYNIDAIFTFNDPINKMKTYSYKEENILIYGTESNLQGFNYLIRDINHEKF
jgi:hypothetical protein